MLIKVKKLSKVTQLMSGRGRMRTQAKGQAVLRAGTLTWHRQLECPLRILGRPRPEDHSSTGQRRLMKMLCGEGTSVQAAQALVP